MTGDITLSRDGIEVVVTAEDQRYEPDVVFTYLNAGFVIVKNESVEAGDE